jgi:hypothetical protein
MPVFTGDVFNADAVGVENGSAGVTAYQVPLLSIRKKKLFGNMDGIKVSA